MSTTSLWKETTMRIAEFAVLGILVTSLVQPADAGNSRRQGTAGAQELRIPVSAHGVAIGEGYLADVSGVEALYYNPAGIAKLDGTEVYFTHMDYLANTDKDYVAGVTKTGLGTIGLSIDVFSIGNIEETTEANPEGTGRIFSPTFSVIGLSYARFLTDAVSVGGTAKLINESILDERARGVAFDVGVQYRPGWQGVRLGFLLKQLGPDLVFTGGDFDSFHQTTDDPNASPRSLASQSAKFELPSVFQMGLAYTPYEQGDHRVDTYGTFVNNNFGDDQYRLGVEYRFRDLLALRAGGIATEDKSYNFGPAFGVGLGVPLGTSRVSVDYARRIVKDYFDDNDVISLKFSF
jgi:hypothetical protein